jgi:ribosomal protein S18 acetylase RimI-like enzyme
MHVLDNPIWHALTGPHATLAERAPLAARYLPDVSVFAAVPDDPTPEAWDDLRGLVAPGGIALLARRDLVVPDGWSVEVTIPCRQMWLTGALVPACDDAPHETDDGFLPLGAGDVPEMLALVERTKPGPFAARTIELGTYLGLRDGGDLVAMAGERLHPPGFTEISAVCTDASHRGRGLASRLVRAIVQGIWARAEKPFLHLTLENEPAHRIYAALGFETRALADVVGLRAPV